MLAPAKVLKPGQSSPSFSDKQVELYKKRFVEGYDLHDPQYEMWLKANHLEALSRSDADSYNLTLVNLSQLNQPLVVHNLAVHSLIF